MADLWVMNSQHWLNERYGGVSGFKRVTEDGATGWQTMYALTRALQYELGIASLSDNFGAGTVAAFNSRLGSISSTTANEGVVGILQCAIWCKGFAGDTVFGRWSDVVANSVVSMRTALGLPSTPRVDVKLMKSLLTMDAYTKTAGGSDIVRAGQQWLNSKYNQRAQFSIIPCDGHFTRDVQRGFLFGVQYEIGMDDATANGNFGPGTQSGLKTQANLSSGSSDGAKNFVSLFQLALAFNGYEVARSGVFNAGTRTATLDFQRFMEITAGGGANYDTWAALLVSTGNPDRPVTMIDTITSLQPAFATKMRAAGYSIIGRYLSVLGKAIERGELDVAFNAGFRVVPIFQNFNNGPQYFSKAIGFDHGSQAALRARQLGFRDQVVIFFAVDYDAFDSEVETLLKPYFEGVAEGLLASRSIRYRIGVYATRNVAQRLHDLRLVEAVWVSGMSTGFSGNLGFPMPKEWWYNQIQEDKTLNIDRNAVSVRAQPTTRDMVLRTPDSTDSGRTLHWNLVRQLVLAERAIGSSVVLPIHAASTYLTFYLMRTKYAYGPFLLYVPYPQNRPGIPSDVQLAHDRAFREYFEAAGLPALITAEYEGDLEHLAVAVQGINYWGLHEGNPSVGIGDLGGWALDVVQLWANYRKFGAGRSIEAFVTDNLGGSDPNTSEWRLPDLISDADGYFIGRDIRNGISFTDSMANLFVASPGWQTRVALFVKARFGRSGMTLNASIQQNVASIFGSSWPYPAVPRAGFQEGQTDPTAAELTQFQLWVARKLLSKAGLSEDS